MTSSMREDLMQDQIHLFEQSRSANFRHQINYEVSHTDIPSKRRSSSAGEGEAADEEHQLSTRLGKFFNLVC